MNYFPFDPDPRESAIALDDKRLARVFHEAVMTLSRAQYRQTGVVGPYSPRVPIPGGLFEWVIGEGEGWFVAWTHAMSVALIERKGQKHVNGYACYQAYLTLDPRFGQPHKVWYQPESFPNLARAKMKRLDYTNVADTHKAYRDYVLVQWNGLDKRGCSWGCHGRPLWAQSGIAAELQRFGVI